MQNLHTIFRISTSGGNSLDSFVYSGMWLEFLVDCRVSRMHHQALKQKYIQIEEELWETSSQSIGIYLMMISPTLV
jgi:hypothetical protein